MSRPEHLETSRYLRDSVSPVRTGGRPASDLIEKALNQRELGRRGLARLLTGNDGDQKSLERWRRAIYRALDDRSLTAELAGPMEVELGLPEGSIPRYEPRRQDDGAILSRAQLTARLVELGATVERMMAAAEANERRIAALERRLARRARESS